MKAPIVMNRQEDHIVTSRADVLVWFIWQLRNNKVWNSSTVNAAQTGLQAAAYWQQWASINGVLNDQNQSNQQRITVPTEIHWQQPPMGVLKCNVDASFYTAIGATGWGWCLRDSRGHFKLAGTNIVNSPYSVVEGEALALLLKQWRS
ncbi:hypothetical protein QL285_022600 [Trifolium repens]|nr:hypothetical protein QL285_022600 [Trifolium repens]